MHMIWFGVGVLGLVVVLGSISPGSGKNSYSASHDKNSKTSKLKSIQDFSNKEPVASLEGYMHGGMVVHPLLTTEFDYDPNELFLHACIIPTNIPRRLLVEKHDPSLFQDLTYDQWKILTGYIVGKKEFFRYLHDWDETRARYLLRSITAEDLMVISKTPNGPYFFGLLFKFLPTNSIVNSNIEGPCMSDFFCMLTSRPFLHVQEYDLGDLLKRFPIDWVRKHWWLIENKIGYSVNLSRNPPIPSERNNDKNLAERFFIDTGIVEKGRSPFNGKDFENHSERLFEGITGDRFESFIDWAMELQSPRRITSQLTRTDLKEISSDTRSCTILANILDKIDPYNLPVSTGITQAKAILSRIDWHDEEYPSLKILKQMNSLWKDKYKEALIPKCFDHFPRDPKMKPSIAAAEKLVSINQNEAEEFFLQNGIILDGIKPFTVESFPKRTANLLSRASSRGLANLASWIKLGDIHRAAQLTEALTADDLSRINEFSLLHLFAEVFPMMNMESVVAANFETSAMKILLQPIAELESRYKFHWSVLERFPRTFFEVQAYSSAVLQVISKKLHFHQMPTKTLKLLNLIYDDRIGHHQFNLATHAKSLIDEEQLARVETIERGLKRITKIDSEMGALSFFELENKRDRVEMMRKRFHDGCFELEMALSGEIDEAIKKLAKIRDNYIEAVDGLALVHKKFLKKLI